MGIHFSAFNYLWENKGILVLWAIGVVGLLLKMISGTYLNSMIKASENMATTKKRRFRIMRQKYENGRNLGIYNGDGKAFAEKQVRSIRILGAPLVFWERSGLVCSLLAWFIMAGAFLYKELDWRGSSEMITFLANGVMVCAFLLMVENIFVTNNKVEILKASIQDYLEKLAPMREKQLKKIEQLKENRKASYSSKDYDIRGKTQGVEEIASSAVDENAGSVVDEKYSSEVDENTGSEVDGNSSEVLNSFLKEFFS